MNKKNKLLTIFATSFVAGYAGALGLDWAIRRTVKKSK
jgi:hypothetical protein